MKKIVLIIFTIVSITNLKSQCLNADNLNITNITHINALANWDAAPGAHHYLIHYRVLGSANWSNLGNIDSTMTSRNILVKKLTTYE